MPKVLLPLAVGFEEIEAITIADVLRRADVEVVLVALEDLYVKGAHGIVVIADALLNDVDAHTFDMIALPGGLPGAFHLAEHPTLQSILREFDTNGKAIAAICAAPYALKRAGVLKNAYTCYPSFETKIDHKGYVSELNIVQDENITTSKGPSTAMLFALSLVEQLCGMAKKEELSRALLLS